MIFQMAQLGYLRITFGLELAMATITGKEKFRTVVTRDYKDDDWFRCKCGSCS